MCATFTDDDLEKRVENENGEVIGIVTAVDGESATVEPRSGVLNSLRARLGWSESTSETITVRTPAVDEITNEAVRLEVEPMAEPDSEPPLESEERPSMERDESESENISTEPATSPITETDEEADPEFATDDPERGRIGEEPEYSSTGEPGERDRFEEPDEQIETDEPMETNAADRLEETIEQDVTPLEEESGDTDAIEGEHDETDTIEESHDDIDATEVDETTRGTAEPDDVSDESGGETETRDLADELDPGIDDDSLEEVGGTDDEDEIEDREPATEIDYGPDVDSAMEESESSLESTGAGTSGETERTDPADELETGVDIDAVAESEPETGAEEGTAGSEPGIEADAVDEEPAAEIDPGVDVVSSAKESRDEEDEPETKGERVDEGTGDETTRRVTPEADVSTVDVADAEESGGESRTRGTALWRSSMLPVSATASVQRAALETGRNSIEYQANVQRDAARTALEGATAVQKSTLAFATATGRSYLNAVESIADGRGRSDASTAGLEDDELADEFADHVADVRELQESIESEGTDHDDDERVAELLERQVTLLERCQEQFESGDG
ncbi:putative sodium/potassium/calcium exchanger [Natronobacterium texcoconense]|uniref:Uncharacterized protein n=1 Tax=Natronobacterium texcoconense TaxID=1095778 RepID=A0A1H1IT27_NATTX|nr:hypothetical protein [Natronobacterium texcoconense]SDR40448.1 hypothetical protein SAMN04489842_3769 [Natronobacterium texcoconense]